MLLKGRIAVTISNVFGAASDATPHQDRLPFTVAAPFPFAAEPARVPCEVIIQPPELAERRCPPGFSRLAEGRPDSNDAAPERRDALT